MQYENNVNNYDDDSNYNRNLKTQPQLQAVSEPVSSVPSYSVGNVVQSSESFLYKYRWWVVLVLACLLAYYLYTRRVPVGSRANIFVSSEPGSATLSGLLSAAPAPTVTDLNPEIRALFNF